MDKLPLALAAWQDKLGAKHVSVEAPTLGEYQTATFATAQKVLAVLHPESRDEVQACLKIADEYRISLFPISTGKNWGYGSRVPARDGVVLDLSRLNRIVAFDESLAYVTIEPGVTQRQLYEFLTERRAGLFFSATGASPDSSLVGNVIERGLGEGPYGDRFDHVCGFEVVLATGESLHMGFSRFVGARASPVHKWGVGPYLEGMFTQSNFGVVTEMTLWLTPKPKHFEIIRYSIDEDRHLEALVEAVRYLKLQNIVRGGFVIANDVRTLSSRQIYPWTETNGQTPLPKKLRHRLSRQSGEGMWSGEAAIYSPSEAHAKATRDLILNTLRPVVSKLYVLNEEMFTIDSLDFAQLYPELNRGEALHSFQENPKRGVPNESAIRMTYWRKRIAAPEKNLNPDRDRCGILWCSPTAPLRGTDVREAITIIAKASAAHGFEPNIGLNCVTDRSVNITAAIVYDRDVPKEDARAFACYRAMSEELIGAGYIPYRLGVQAMSSLPMVRDDYGNVIKRLKKALDPNGILAPGRYEA